MRFYFTSDDKMLKAPASQGGCGVTAEEITAVTVWQQNFTYQFEFHLENHGSYVYIFPDGRRAGQKDMPRFYFADGRMGMFDNDESLVPGVRSDVRAVVNGNRALFASMHGRFYGIGGVAKKTVESVPTPAIAVFACLNPKCVNYGAPIAVKFESQQLMHRLITVSNFGGIRSSEYPAIKCARGTCGLDMELVEFGPKAKGIEPKETVAYAG